VRDLSYNTPLQMYVQYLYGGQSKQIFACGVEWHRMLENVAGSKQNLK
jgi:hypothetical protein